MWRTPALALAACTLASLAAPASAPATRVLILGAGRVRAHEDRFVGPADPAGRAGPGLAPARGTRGLRAKPPGPTVRAELDRLLAAAAIDQATRDRDRALYDTTQAALRRLSGRRLTELKAVTANLDALAASGGLTPDRLPLAFATLEANRRWWTTGALLGYGQRVGFASSELVWQSYPGQGIQVQWLGTFGKANALFTGGRHYDPRLRALVDEALPLASARAGGLAWESLFAFDGGRPPWVSALSQGTALQALSRAAVRLQDPALFAAARGALGVFRTPPPEGVRVDTAVGAHYLQYSFAPGLRILNGFVQSINGLSDFAKFANDDEGRALFAAGDAEARAELPQFDTGAWSLYSQAGGRGLESDLGYHRLLTQFLRGLCDRETAAGLDAAPYCDTAARFAAYEHRPPVLALQAARPATPRVGRGVRVAYTLSKLSTVTTTVSRGGAIVASRRARAGRGGHTLAFTPRATGAYAIRVAALDLVGNVASVSGALRVRPKSARAHPE